MKITLAIPPPKKRWVFPNMKHFMLTPPAQNYNQSQGSIYGPGPTASLWLPHSGDTVSERCQQLFGIDQAIIVDTNESRADLTARAVCSTFPGANVEIMDWEGTVDSEMQDRREQLEALLANNGRILVITNYFAMEMLRAVQDAVETTGNGVRAWITSCMSGTDINQRKKKMGIRIGTRHIPYRSDREDRFADDVAMIAAGSTNFGSFLPKRL